MRDPFRKIIQITQLQHPLFAVYGPRDGDTDQKYYARPVWHLAVSSNGEVFGIEFSWGKICPVGCEMNCVGLYDIRDMNEDQPHYGDIIEAIYEYRQKEKW